MIEHVQEKNQKNQVKKNRNFSLKFLVHEGIRKLESTIKKENPHLNKIHTKQITDVRKSIESNSKSKSDEIIKCDNPSSFITNVIQKVFRVSPKYTDPQASKLQKNFFLNLK